MKILITGAKGMLGSDLTQAFEADHKVLGVGRGSATHLTIPYFSFDLTDQRRLTALVEKERPEIIFHTAAMTDVDGCQSQPQAAQRDNVEVTKNVTQAANRVDAPVVFFSTDYVFDGKKKGEYTEQDQPNPLSVYAKTKVEAEQEIQSEAKAFVIFRTSWLFGFHGRSFPRSILEKASAAKKIRVVSDQIGRPTYTRDFARALADLLSRRPHALREAAGDIFHAANAGSVSWSEFARQILTEADQTEVKVESIHTPELDRPAPRPLNSVLSLEKSRRMLGIQLRPWQEALHDFIQELKSNGMVSYGNR